MSGKKLNGPGPRESLSGYVLSKPSGSPYVNINSGNMCISSYCSLSPVGFVVVEALAGIIFLGDLCCVERVQESNAPIQSTQINNNF